MVLSKAVETRGHARGHSPFLTLHWCFVGLPVSASFLSCWEIILTVYLCPLTLPPNAPALFPMTKAEAQDIQLEMLGLGVSRLGGTPYLQMGWRHDCSELAALGQGQSWLMFLVSTLWGLGPVGPALNGHQPGWRLCSVPRTNPDGL